MTVARPLLVIAAGGTGGHMFPAQALAETMLARGWRVTLATDPRGARYAGGFPPLVERQVTASGSFAQGGALQPARRRRCGRCAASGRPAWRASAATRRCRR